MKGKPNISYAQILEEGGEATEAFETMYSLVVGDGSNPVAVKAPGVDGFYHAPGPNSAIQSALDLTDHVDIVVDPNTPGAGAHFDGDGNFVPAKDISTHPVYVIWIRSRATGTPSSRSASSRRVARKRATRPSES